MATGTYRLKAGQGTHWFRQPDGRETPIRAGETIECEAWQLGGSIDRFEVVTPPPPPPPPEVGLKAVHRGAGRYDVINEATGKPINSATLSKSEAQELIDDAPIHEWDEDDESPRVIA